MIQVIKAQSKIQMEQCFSIRKSVFIEEQGIDAELEYDGLDESSSHFIALVKDIAVGCMRLRDCGDVIKIERLSVLKAYRGSGAGRELMSFVQAWAEKYYSGKKLTLHAQESATSFYYPLGWEDEGQVHVEAGIPHQKMIYKGESVAN